jgi:alkylglycerol monooxygenase
MEHKYAAFAIPAFFIFLGLEYIVAVKRKQTYLYRYESSVANIAIGIAERLLNLFVSVSFYKLFKTVHEKYSLFDIPDTWVTWIILILATDFIWYWYHRLGHEVNILWGAHIVHHQSEEFNYTVSARITTIQALIRNAFWCVLPFIGFPPGMVMITLIIHGAYSFFTHTQLVKNMGFLEYIFVTPSVHGVHHASNEKYLNKNYGDLFVFWDKLFGTYAKEDEKPIYGLTHQLKSYSFIWQHFHYYLEIFEACRRVRGFSNKLRIVFGNPDTLDQNIRTALEEQFLSRSGSNRSTQKFRAYLTIQMLAITLLLFLMTFFFLELDSIEKSFGSLFILITLINCGALLEQRKWIYYLEITRMFVLIGYLNIHFTTNYLLAFAILLTGFLMGAERVQRWYLRLVYDIES